MDAKHPTHRVDQFIEAQDQVKQRLTKLRTVSVFRKQRSKDSLGGDFLGRQDILYCERGCVSQVCEIAKILWLRFVTSIYVNFN